MLVTGTSLTLTDDGALLVLPPRQRVEFLDGKRVACQPPGRLYRADGTVSLIDAARGEA